MELYSHVIYTVFENNISTKLRLKIWYDKYYNVVLLSAAVSHICLNLCSIRFP
jgi:hypothetical protein